MEDCVNFECKSTEDLKPAPLFACTFYGAPSNSPQLNKKWLICTACYHAAVDRQEELVKCLSEQKPILEYENQFPSHSLQVELCNSDDSDMDQEECNGSDYLPEAVLLDMEKQMGNVLNSIIQKYDIDYQVEHACKTLKQQWDKIEETTADIDKHVKKMQCDLDHLREGLYERFNPRIQSVPIWSEIVTREVKGTLLSSAPPASLDLVDYLVV